MAYSHEAPRAITLRRTSRTRAGALAMPRRRGVGSGTLLVLLGIWGAIIPFIGPMFGYSIGTAGAWAFTWDRLWLNILPGAAAFFGGLILIAAADRLTATAGAWLSFAGGAWFVIGPSVSLLWGSPIAVNGIGSGSDVQRFIEQIGYFYGLGAVVIGLAAGVWARVLVRSTRDALLLESAGPVTETAETVPGRPMAEPYATPVVAEGPTAQPYRERADAGGVAADVPPGADLRPRRVADGVERRTDPMAERDNGPMTRRSTDPMAEPAGGTVTERGTGPMTRRSTDPMAEPAGGMVTERELRDDGAVRDDRDLRDRDVPLEPRGPDSDRHLRRG